MYYHTDPSRERVFGAIPDCEVFLVTQTESEYNRETYPQAGFYFAYGFPGCLWDSDPNGPYLTERKALEAAREQAGY